MYDDASGADQPAKGSFLQLDSELNPGDRVEDLGNFGRPTGEFGTVEQTNEDNACKVGRRDDDGRMRLRQPWLKKLSALSSHQAACALCDQSWLLSNRMQGALRILSSYLVVEHQRANLLDHLCDFDRGGNRPLAVWIGPHNLARSSASHHYRNSCCLRNRGAVSNVQRLCSR